MGRVCCYGDSQTAWYGPTDWPSLLGVLKPGMQVLNAGLAGRTTDCMANFDGTMIYGSGGGTITDVVFLLGINDLSALNSTPAQTVTRLKALADWTTGHWNARAWVCTLLPCTSIPFGGGYMPPWPWSQQVNHALFAASWGASQAVIDVRDEYARKLRWDSSASTDGLHPTGQAARQVIAEAVAAVVP